VTNFVPGVTGQEPAPRYPEFEDLGQGDTGLAAQQSGRGIEGDEAIQPARREQRSAFKQAGIAVRAAHADR